MDQDIYDKYFGHRRALEKHALSHIKDQHSGQVQTNFTLNRSAGILEATNYI